MRSHPNVEVIGDRGIDVPGRETFDIDEYEGAIRRIKYAATLNLTYGGVEAVEKTPLDFWNCLLVTLNRKSGESLCTALDFAELWAVHIVQTGEEPDTTAVSFEPDTPTDIELYAYLSWVDKRKGPEGEFDYVERIVELQNTIVQVIDSPPTDFTLNSVDVALYMEYDRTTKLIGKRRYFHPDSDDDQNQDWGSAGDKLSDIIAVGNLEDYFATEPEVSLRSRTGYVYTNVPASYLRELCEVAQNWGSRNTSFDDVATPILYRPTAFSDTAVSRGAYKGRFTVATESDVRVIMINIQDNTPENLRDRLPQVARQLNPVMFADVFVPVLKKGDLLPGAALSPEVAANLPVKFDTKKAEQVLNNTAELKEKLGIPGMV